MVPRLGRGVAAHRALATQHLCGVGGLARQQVLDEVPVAGDARRDGLVDPAQVVEQHACVGGPLLTVAGGGPGDEGVEVVGYAGGQPRRRRHVLVDVLVGDLDRRLALVRLLAGEELVEDHAHGVDVGPGVGAALDDELGCDVRDGPDEDAGRGVLGGGAHRLGQPEVGDLDPAVVGDEDVLGLDVTVDQAGAVRGRQCGHHRLEQREGAGGRERRLLADGVTQRVAGDQLHGQEDGAVVVALVEDRHDVGVRELRRRPGLGHEAGRELVVVTETGVHHLHRDGAVEPQVGGLVDGRHAAAGDPRPDHVAAVEHPAGQVVRGVEGRVVRLLVGALGGMPVRRHGDLLHPDGEGSGWSIVRTSRRYGHFRRSGRAVGSPRGCGAVRLDASMGA